MTRSSQPWKALILAAGYGTRLLPHTRYMPKPLFTIDNVPVLDMIIAQLTAAGCGGVVINTHHLSEKIEQHCHSRRYDIPVLLSREPEVLGTGGAMKNNAGFFGDSPFLVINGDIVTDISLEAVRRFHEVHGQDVTMVMHDRREFNSVTVDENGHVVRFYRMADEKPADARLLAFTGIHVIHPRVLDSIPETGVYVDIIDVYTDMLARGEIIEACFMEGHQWQDIGTPEAYQAIAFEHMAHQALQTAFGETTLTAVNPLASDGSDTRWYRILSPKGSLIVCNRGVNTADVVSEAEAFTRINQHLLNRGVAVPRIYLSDCMAGLAFMADLGDITLQSTVRSLSDENDIIQCYRQVIDRLLKLAVAGAEGFDDAWAYQTASYDRQLILERECRYFTEAFLEGYLGMDTGGMELEAEFGRLADLTLRYAVNGLIHRDMQSRNIMISNGRPFFIDAQGARRGPAQYDLAALLIDPYVRLSPDVQSRLMAYYETGLLALRPVNRDEFRKGYACCAVTRNLQILGAFGFLTRKKQKPHFESYIPAAAESLPTNVAAVETCTDEKFPELAAVAKKARETIDRLLADNRHA